MVDPIVSEILVTVNVCDLKNQNVHPTPAVTRTMAKIKLKIIQEIYHLR